MKYCYRCGKAYKGDLCPNCFTDLYTDKPNPRTTQTKDENKPSEDFNDLLRETNKL